MRPIRRLSALLLTLVLLVGTPYVLLRYLPWPDLDLSWSVLVVHLSGLGLPPGLGTALLTGALWVLWALYALGVAVEVVARARGAAPRLRPLGPLQVIAATAIGGSILAPAQAFADTVEVREDAPEAGVDDGTDTAETAETGQADQDEVSDGSSVQRHRVVSGFAVGSADTTEEMREDLAGTVQLIRDHGDPETPVLVTGHTDPSGPAAVNLELSERRAQAVADHLTAELGDDAPTIETRGLGSGEPLSDASDSALRRAEVNYSVVPAPPAAPETPAPTTPSESAAGQDEPEPAPTESSEVVLLSETTAGDPGDDEAAVVAADSPDVVVLEVPSTGVVGAVGFAGILGGFLLGRRRAVALSLPRARSRPRALTERAHRALDGPTPVPMPREGDGVDDRVAVELTHLPGVGITGPGALGAARTLIANALTAGSRRDARILVDESDAAVLLGEEGSRELAAERISAVRVVPTPYDALAALQRELHEVGNDDVSTDDRAPLVLVATPHPEHEAALSGLLLHGQERGVTAVLLGRWPLGGSCVIDADGVVTATNGPLTRLDGAYWPGSDADRVAELVRNYHGLPEVPETVQDAEADERGDAPVRSVAPTRRERPERSEWSERSTSAAVAAEGIGAQRAWDAFTRAFDEEDGLEVADRDRDREEVAPAPPASSAWRPAPAEPEPVALSEPELHRERETAELATVPEAVPEPVSEAALEQESVPEHETAPEREAVSETVPVAEPVSEVVPGPAESEPVSEVVPEPAKPEPVPESERQPAEAVSAAFSVLNQPPAPAAPTSPSAEPRTKPRREARPEAPRPTESTADGAEEDETEDAQQVRTVSPRPRKAGKSRILRQKTSAPAQPRTGG